MSASRPVPAAARGVTTATTAAAVRLRQHRPRAHQRGTDNTDCQ
jgi:hypothetical protein